jgi:hypothetical protein
MDAGPAIVLVVSALLVVSMLYLFVSSVRRRGSGRSLPEAPPVPDAAPRDRADPPLDRAPGRPMPTEEGKDGPADGIEGTEAVRATQGRGALPADALPLQRAGGALNVTTGSVDPPESEPSTAASVSAAEPAPPRPADPEHAPHLLGTREAPEYTMVAPVELSFADGSHRVGIPAGSAIFLKYQSLAAVLRDDLKRARRR